MGSATSGRFRRTPKGYLQSEIRIHAQEGSPREYQLAIDEIYAIVNGRFDIVGEKVHAPYTVRTGGTRL